MHPARGCEDATALSHSCPPSQVIGFLFSMHRFIIIPISALPCSRKLNTVHLLDSYPKLVSIIFNAGLPSFENHNLY